LAISIRLNGEQCSLDEGTSVSGLLLSRGVEPRFVSVELNGVILKRENYGSTIIEAGDAVEFLYYMGGGSLSLGLAD
jgi:sulfur carrier protein